MSGAINLKPGRVFKTFIKDKVISTFEIWTGKQQFVVMMLMDSDSNWDKFKFSPKHSNKLS